MSDEARDRNDQRVRGPQLKVWLIAVIALFAGIVIRRGPMGDRHAFQARLELSGWPTIIALITLGGVLVTVSRYMCAVGSLWRRLRSFGAAHSWAVGPLAGHRW